MPIRKAMQRCVAVMQYVPIHWFSHSHQKQRGRNGPLKSPKSPFCPYVRRDMANSYARNSNGLEDMSIFVVDGLTPQNPKNRFNVVSDKTDSMADT